MTMSWIRVRFERRTYTVAIRGNWHMNKMPSSQEFSLPTAIYNHIHSLCLSRAMPVLVTSCKYTAEFSLSFRPDVIRYPGPYNPTRDPQKYTNKFRDPSVETYKISIQNVVVYTHHRFQNLWDCPILHKKRVKVQESPSAAPKPAKANTQTCGYPLGVYWNCHNSTGNSSCLSMSLFCNPFIVWLSFSVPSYLRNFPTSLRNYPHTRPNSVARKLIFLVFLCFCFLQIICHG